MGRLLDPQLRVERERPDVGGIPGDNRAGSWIALTTGGNRRGAQLAIENTGRRIPDGELARLFEPFEQPSSPKGRARIGFGLGLTIVKAVVDAHHALLTARARPRGLPIRVTFPCVQDAPRSVHQRLTRE